MILFWLVVSQNGTQKLCRWYAPYTEEEQTWVLLQVKQQLLLPRPEAADSSNGGAREGSRENETSRVLMFAPLHSSRGSNSSSSRAVFRQHGPLYCIAGINAEETPLVIGELIDLWVGVLQQLLGVPAAAGGAVLETQLSLHIEPALLLLDTMLQQGYLVCTDTETLLARVRELMKQD
ncbi:hypothetical protein, conserved [Eimeria tenella]|uniref:AP complex mu/sigma subunit domain-containing protein n=1 Tax=Eimeria tenella TaxID=5802 RepID=U6KSS0_EIMTE|nr:hypothetical protein, conserved [Eimeria tenella]CDJ41177.1 hypothetical protein, conserved [Eimeria tenella]|eukprot:XP_013231927.1 hypothetical protein, conserved [Eimeria tenella]